MDKMQENFKTIKSVRVDGDYILITYTTKRGNQGNEDGSKNNPHPRLAWLIEKAREAGKLQ